MAANARTLVHLNFICDFQPSMAAVMYKFWGFAISVPKCIIFVVLVLAFYLTVWCEVLCQFLKVKLRLLALDDLGSETH